MRGCDEVSFISSDVCLGFSSACVCLFGRSLDFCCDACGSCMRSALLALSPDSDPRPVDPQAHRLAQQINFKVRVIYDQNIKKYMFIKIIKVRHRWFKIS